MASIFDDLKTGDQILIKKGFGTLPVAEDGQHIVLDTRGNSLLTASGVCLSSHDEEGIFATGNHFKPGTFEVSPEAEELLDDLHRINAVVIISF
jgi:hypothetical protein